MIAQAKRDKWAEFVNSANEKSIWQVKKYIDSKPVQTVIPTLDGHAAINSEKTDVLKRSFFPAPPPADLSDLHNYQYPEDVPFQPVITVQQIRNAIKRATPSKAPGPDGITNKVLQQALPTLE